MREMSMTTTAELEETTGERYRLADRWSTGSVLDECVVRQRHQLRCRKASVRRHLTYVKGLINLLQSDRNLRVNPHMLARIAGQLIFLIFPSCHVHKSVGTQPTSAIPDRCRRNQCLAR